MRTTGGFSVKGNDFEPEDLTRLAELLNSEPNNDAILLYQLHVATQYLSVSVGSKEKTLENYNVVNTFLQEHEEKHGKTAVPFYWLGFAVFIQG